MTEERLRRWALGELPPDERREVTRWVVSCTDPDLGPLLDGILREAEEARRDGALAGLGRAWDELVARWRGLLDEGAAGWSGGPSPTLAGAGGTSALVRVEAAGDRVTVDVSVSATALEVAVYLTDDTGRCDRLVPPGPVVSPGRAEFVVSVGPRPTAWTCAGPALPRATTPLDELNAALGTPGVERSALRWDPTEG